MRVITILLVGNSQFLLTMYVGLIRFLLQRSKRTLIFLKMNRTHKIGGIDYEEII
jgi:hypothetical protein